MHKFVCFSAVALLGLAGSVNAAEGAAAAAPMGVNKNLTDQKFEAFPGTPACITGVVLSGDPDKGPSLLEAKFTSGCTVPWHWHSSDEHVMMASGIGKMDMKDEAKPITLRAGAYSMLPGHHPHQFTCVSACVLFLRSDGVFDTHYINADGKEIPPEEALAKKKK
jgi:quercetin dioxygenase-like cupin family protein